jgi:hypothetical protein
VRPDLHSVLDQPRLSGLRLLPDLAEREAKSCADRGLLR